MKAIIFDPYLDIIGGGEVYTVSFTKWALKNGYEVEILWNDGKILERINTYLGIDVRQAKVNVYGYWMFSKTGISRTNFRPEYPWSR